jgi:Heat shock protein 9/12
MSDTGRKGLGDKVSEGVTPDSQKSTLDQGKEAVTDTADKVAG